VIDRNRVYQKSAKGAEAIATRQHGLGPKLRSMLIMVDGKRVFDELVKLSSTLGDTEQLLSQLLEQGFIEHGAVAQLPTTAPAPLAASPVQALSLAEAQRFISRRLTDLLGPNAEVLCLRIEAARNVHDFQVAVKQAEGMLRQFKSANVAAAFSAEVQAHMPAG
jgi:hypothetical protein